MKSLRVTALLIAVLTLMLAVLACGQFGPAATPEPTWVPGPLAPSTPGEILTGGQEPGTGIETATVEPAPSGSEVEPTAGPPTVDPHRVVITERDLAAAIAGGAGSDAGFQTEGLEVHFTGGKTQIAARRVGYGMLSVDNLALSGPLVARDGVLQMDVESVSPQGMVGAMIPGIVNQALKQYASRWYVEDVQTREGEIELRVR